MAAPDERCCREIPSDPAGAGDLRTGVRHNRGGQAGGCRVRRALQRVLADREERISKPAPGAGSLLRQ